MDEKTKAELLNRLRSITGHVNGIARMLEEDKYWIDILQQILAVQSAMSKVGAHVLDIHLRTCLAEAMASNDPTEHERALQEILDVFEWRSKLNS
jgi:DNA-binding FrmR family transcriptional regulator